MGHLGIETMKHKRALPSGKIKIDYKIVNFREIKRGFKQDDLFKEIE